MSPIDGTRGAQAPFFSPDGQWIGFFANDTLQKVPVSGGPPVKICDAQVLFPGASWGSDGTIVFADNTAGLVKVSANSGVPERLTRPTEGAFHIAPHVLPGGRDLLFTVRTETEDLTAVLSYDSSDWRPLLPGSGWARYVPSGHLVYNTQSGALMAVAFDPDQLAIRGSPIPMLEQVSQGPEEGLLHLATSDTGTLVYAPAGAGAAQLSLVRVGREGQPTPLQSDTAAYAFPRISPDGRRIAATVGGGDIWVYDANTGVGRPVTTEGSNSEPIWSPDGERITFTSLRSGSLGFDLYSVPADRRSEPRRVLSREGRQFRRFLGAVR